MAFIHGWLIFACFVTFVFCGVIDQIGENGIVKNEENLQDNVNDCALEGGENTLLGIHETFPTAEQVLGSVKQKRCPQ